MEPEQENYTSFMHLHANSGRITAAIVLDGDKEQGTSVAHVSMSFCSPKDQFCRKTGRTIAEGRLKKKKFIYSIPLGDTKGVKDMVRQTIYQHIKDGNVEGFPQWARE